VLSAQELTWIKADRRACVDKCSEQHEPSFERVERSGMTEAPRDTVGVVDDDGAVRHSFRLLLEVIGHKVEAFASAADFLKAELGRFVCLIVDHHMPDMTGLELAARLRAEGSGALFRDKDGWAVFVVVDGVAHRRTVVLSQRAEASAAVQQGLNPDDTVILFPTDAIAEGVRVRPR
jgi:CheY-like chemotaxis protein